ncbi:PPOX class F420-dependent oxidoreductase [Amnibacterium sp. CER49]|uniref:PPOX class F420-dependent oxidoreductase n=1 Tax=Amnibacterium sp. CER49 TaxID=3039161 RepID=UPI00244728D3|nr:PPOX class F420-dependent oxidoreductase [Amnibacterium sp. CER49]MDH2442895.1 PPOX class F420-dependent oxidoreductase [Amnibacterium sp. CER49]
MPLGPDLAAAGRRRYVSLTTFRRSGVPVATPVWVAPYGDALVVTTHASTGKAKRLRNDPAVELRECDARGRVRPGAPVVLGRAEVLDDPADHEGPLAALGRKYGLVFGGFQLIERLAERRGAKRVILRITDRAA